MRIALGGLAGSGTTTLANLLSEELGLKVVSSGEIFRKFAEDSGMSVEDFSKLCERDPSTDKKIDEYMRNLSMKEKNAIFEGRLVGYFTEAELKVWLKAPVDERAKRIAQRENISFELALKRTLEREESERKRYLSYYGIDIDDTSPYHVVLDSEYFNAEQLKEVVVCAVSVLG
jgi:cytidylate kinase